MNQGMPLGVNALSELVRRGASAPRGEDSDVIVIGAGFGGLGAALSLAERGYRVHLIESLRYPGGCAGTFTRGGYQFEAGATLSSGFSPGQLFHSWIDRYGLPIACHPLEKIITFRSDLINIDISHDREALIEHLCQGREEAERVRAFFKLQSKVSGSLWRLFEDPSLLPPFTLKSLLQHAGRLPEYLPLIKTLSRPLGALIDQHKLRSHEGLILYLNALCQITSQCGVDEVEAPFGLATMDYYYRGVRHVEGGLGALAWCLCHAIQQAGGRVSLSKRARGLRYEGGWWRVDTRDGELKAPLVVSNLIPSALERLLSEANSVQLPQWINDRQSALEEGWSAAMLYLVTESPSGQERGPAEHWQLIADARAPLMEGNHVFCSISSSGEHQKAPAGSRVMTLSTHIPMSRFREMGDPERAHYIKEIQARMRDTFEARCPQWANGIYFAMSASPRTFERFTGRPMGYVGGAPRRAGFKQYLNMSPKEVLKGLYMVGDSHFPGQSTLATATGGHRLAALIDR